MRSKRPSENLTATKEEIIQTVSEKETLKPDKRKRNLDELLHSLCHKADELSRLKDSLFRTMGPLERATWSESVSSSPNPLLKDLSAKELVEAELLYRLSSLLDFLRQLRGFEDCGVFILEGEDGHPQKLVLSPGPAGFKDLKEFEDEVGALWKTGGIARAVDEKRRLVFSAAEEGSLLIIPFKVLNQKDGFCAAHFRRSALPDKCPEELLSWAELICSCIENHYLKHPSGSPKEDQLECTEDDKLFATVRLSRAMVHEINNSLQVILGRTQLLKIGERKTGSSNSNVGNLDTIESNASRVCSILKDFSDYLHRQFDDTIVAGEVNLQHILRSDLALLEDIFKSARIKLNLGLDGNLPAVYGHPGELERAFLNLMWGIKDLLLSDGSVSLKMDTEEEFLSLSICCRNKEGRPDGWASAADLRASQRLEGATQILQRYHAELKSEKTENGEIRFCLTFPIASTTSAEGHSPSR